MAFDLQYIKGVGPQRAKILISAGLATAEDLINYFPRAYIDRSVLKNIRSLKSSLERIDESDDLPEISDYRFSREVSIVGKVTDKKLSKMKNREMLKIEVSDNSDRLYVVFWNMAKYFDKVYNINDFLLISGTPELDNFRKLVFTHPDIDKIDEEDEKLFQEGRILPKYKISDVLNKGKINQKILRKIISSVFESKCVNFLETLPYYIQKEHNLQNIEDTINNLHFPENSSKLTESINRMKFDELFYFALNVLLRKSRIKNDFKGIVIKPKSTLARKLYDSLPFELTKDQLKTIKEIDRDLKSGKPMNRLIQGDVGSGKTIVSLLSLLTVIDAGYQVVFMAPTEILAEQHFKNIKNYLNGYEIPVLQLVGGQKKKLRNEIYEMISSGKPSVIIGTHALFQSEVSYTNLGLVIIDEQHRFGVQQRADLIELSRKSLSDNTLSPHVLVLSATPIPRTLSMTVYGDLDVSIIKSMPQNRKPIKTRVAFDKDRERVYNFIRDEIRKGRQAFIVFPLVEKSEKLEFKAATENFELLSKEIFPDLKVGLLHGQMFWYEKEDAMNDFLNRKYDILVSTTVIEVGIDIANATIMMIEDAHKFGLSQLHQLRGRVGRGAEQSYCILMTKDHYKYQMNKGEDSLSSRQSAIIRLKTMERTTDGFEIAEVDLKLRGPGDVMGTKQSGLPDFQFADLINDGELISKIRQITDKLVEEDPNLTKKEHSMIKEELFYRFQNNKSFYNIA